MLESMALASSSSSKSLLGYFGSSSPKNPIGDFTIRRIKPSPSPCFPSSIRGSKVTLRCSRVCASTQSQSNSGGARQKALVKSGFASVSSSKGEQTTSVGYPNTAVPPTSSSFGSPLFWIGVGVGLSALFSWGTSSLKKFAMQQTMKTLMNQMNTQNNQFSNPGFPTGSPFPFPTPTQASPSSSPFQAAPQSSVTVDVSASKVEASPTLNVDPAPSTRDEVAQTASLKEEAKTGKKENKYAFVDVSPEETTQETPFSNYEEVSETSSSRNTQFFDDVLQNGAASKQGGGASGGFQSSGTGKGGPGLSVEALEKMMEDPNVQKMVYPYLPEEMRNPESFKWMMQNPQYRQQLQDMLNNMGGSGEWDKRMVDTLQQFDLNSPDVKQKFNQIGLTPEEVISKVMANPDVALAFQNPRVQAALMDCSENPMNIMKYQNDKEIMDVFNKISELFPGMSGGM